MGNDFPAAVFSNLEKAEHYIAQRKEEDKKALPAHHAPRVYWRANAFNLNNEGE